ncbi:MAG: aquaporin [Saprospiraceae bacterium]|nr:aquaporin [Saprospiraceae bacterium]MBK8451627.1 aquaporin [Saprospiraceae bacterium]MBK9221102.1 aquaporin [Saprospiraceae bacterium]MBK9722046.1 aquaporin [Saprospiraceae bacterium]
MNKYLAEILGTFALVFCGTGAIIINQQTQGAISHVGIAFSFGLIVMVMIYTFGNISGAHLNPAVTIAFALAKKFDRKELVPYILSQILGAFLASFILQYLFPTNNAMLGATIPLGTAMQSFILEFILSYFLMLVIVNVSTGSKEQGMFAGLAIGAMVLLEAMFAGPICGASMNPARSLAPAIVSGHTEYLWVYLIATTLGAACAIPTWKILYRQ